MKHNLLYASLLLTALAALAFGQNATATASPKVTVYSLTEADCSPLSMLMLFPPYPGFSCKESTTVMVYGVEDVAGYEAEIVFERNRQRATERVYMPASQGAGKGEATWVLYGKAIKVLSVTVVPHVARPSVNFDFVEQPQRQ